MPNTDPTYRIWNPYVTDTSPPAVDLYITRYAAWELFDGCARFVRDILDSIGADDRILGWSLTRYRSAYFREHHTDNVEELWPQAWHLHAEMGAKPWLDEVPDHGYLLTDVAEDDVPPDYLDRPEDPPATCLVLADFKTMGDLEQAGRLLEARGAAISVGKGSRQLPQLRIDLGEHPMSFFQDGAGLAAEIEEICEFHGGDTRGT